VGQQTYTRADIHQLTQQAVLDAGYGPLAAVLILRSLGKILERESEPVSLGFNQAGGASPYPRV